MVQIKEFLANPVGPDAAGEYITLINTGSAAVSLAGWSIKDKSGKTFSLTGYSLPPGTQLRLFSSATKIAINNSNETISLFDPAGRLVDELAMTGTAIEGQPFRRTTELTAEVRAQLFDDLATTSLPAVRSPVSDLLLFWLPASLLLGLAAAVGMRTITHNEQNHNQTHGDSGANG